MKLREKIDREYIEASDRFLKNPPPGIKVHNVLYTLGRYDIVIFYEAPSEKEALKCTFAFSEKASTETLVAIPGDEAVKLLRT